MMNHTERVLEFDKIKRFLKKYALSPLGYEVIENMKPLKREEILVEFNILSCLIKELSFKKFPIEKLPDIRETLLASKKEDSVVDIASFLKMRDFLEAIKKIKLFFSSAEAENLKNLGVSLTENNNLLERIKFIFDSEGNVKDNASEELLAIREQIRGLRKVIENKLSGILHNPNYSLMIQENIITVKDDRFVIPIKKDYKAVIKGIVITGSQTGETLFIEPITIIEENNLFSEFKTEEKREIARILKKLTSSIRYAMEHFNEMIKQVSHIELCLVKSYFAIASKSSMPEINSEGVFCIKHARHPLLEQKAVPIDIEIGREFNVLIITGPNTGGKTVAMKTIGLLTLMSMMGMFIPCREGSKIAMVDNIFVDIGDEQNITYDLSTFSAHIESIKNILKNATKDSLILIDEPGAGTDPKDGSAFAVSVIEELIERNSRLILTSHLETIKNMAFHNSKISNASVEFDIKTLLPRYKLRIGVTGKSYALEIAKRLGIPDNIIQRAQNLLHHNQKEYAMEEISEKLNQSIQNMQNEKRKYENMVAGLNKKADELNAKEKELKKIENAVLKKEGGALLESIKETRKKLIRLIEDAKNYQDLENLKQKARELEEISQLTRSMTEQEDKKETLVQESISNIKPSEIEVGDLVIINKFQKEGEVVDINPEKQSVTVMLGNMKMKLNLKEIQFANRKKENKKGELDISIPTPPKVSLEINIIGKRREEALRDIEDYVNGLILNNITEGTIIHGRGSGILREAVKDYLKGIHAVTDFKVSPDGGATHFKLIP